MGDTSKIQWTDATWNPWHGCKKVSEGCKFCYMYRDKDRYGHDGSIVQRAGAVNFNSPLKWKEPKLIFTCSWSDWFIEEADEWRVEAWEIIKNTPQHTYQILTKRPERIMECLPPDWGQGYSNVWLGISTENEEQFLNRITMFRHVPARIKFLSIEPLIEPIDVNVTLWGQIDWVIIGGESGNDNGKYKYRHCELEWIEEIIWAFKNYAVPKKIFVKQLGTYLAKKLKLKDRNGGDFEEFPESVKIREFPIG